jgi:hypothetical protein
MFDDTKYDQLSLRLSLSLIAFLLVSSFVICLFIRTRSKNESKSIYYVKQDLSLSFLLFVHFVPLLAQFHYNLFTGHVTMLVLSSLNYADSSFKPSNNAVLSSVGAAFSDE